MSRHHDPDSPRSPWPSAALTLVLAGLFAAGVFGVVYRVGAQAPGPDPVAAGAAQPIAFSHRVHAADNAIPCQLCHAYARRGPVAGIPSVQRCAQCHLTIATDRSEIRRLMQYWDAREPIPWVRVHDLPDYVRFTHKRHVAAGVDCQTCHGDVARMDAAVQTAPLTMGWCLNCHQTREAPTDCLTCHY
jgi:hypothetical protein